MGDVGGWGNGRMSGGEGDKEGNGGRKDGDEDEEGNNLREREDESWSCRARGMKKGVKGDGHEYQAVNCFQVHSEMCSV